MEALLDGLERVALTSRDDVVKGKAVAGIARSGWKSTETALQGTVARLVRIYRKTSDELVRAYIVSLLTYSAETQAAAAFLSGIVLHGSNDFPEASISAIRAMTRLGEDGRATLRELHRSGRVHDRDARTFLDELSKTGYRMPTPRHPSG